MSHIPSKIIFVKDKNPSAWVSWYHVNGDSKTSIHTARKLAGCVRSSNGLYIPDVEFEEPNEPIYNAVIDGNFYTGTGTDVIVHGKYKVPFVSDHISDIIKLGHIEKGVIKSPLIYVVNGSQLSLVHYEGSRYNSIKAEMEKKKK